jgi:hypothetical protein
MKISFPRFNEVWRSCTDYSEAEEWSTALPVDRLYYFLLLKIIYCSKNFFGTNIHLDT